MEPLDESNNTSSLSQADLELKFSALLETLWADRNEYLQTKQPQHSLLVTQETGASISSSQSHHTRTNKTTTISADGGADILLQSKKNKDKAEVIDTNGDEDITNDGDNASMKDSRQFLQLPHQQCAAAAAVSSATPVGSSDVLDRNYRHGSSQSSTLRVWSGDSFSGSYFYLVLVLMGVKNDNSSILFSCYIYTDNRGIFFLFERLKTAVGMNDMDSHKLVLPSKKQGSSTYASPSAVHHPSHADMRPEDLYAESMDAWPTHTIISSSSSSFVADDNKEYVYDWDAYRGIMEALTDNAFFCSTTPSTSSAVASSSTTMTPSTTTTSSSLSLSRDLWSDDSRQRDSLVSRLSPPRPNYTFQAIEDWITGVTPDWAPYDTFEKKTLLPFWEKHMDPHDFLLRTQYPPHHFYTDRATGRDAIRIMALGYCNWPVSCKFWSAPSVHQRREMLPQYLADSDNLKDYLSHIDLHQAGNGIDPIVGSLVQDNEATPERWANLTVVPIAHIISCAVQLGKHAVDDNPMWLEVSTSASFDQDREKSIILRCGTQPNCSDDDCIYSVVPLASLVSVPMWNDEQLELIYQHPTPNVFGHPYGSAYWLDMMHRMSDMSTTHNEYSSLSSASGDQ